MKLGVYAITKNEQHNVERFCEQTRLFDSVTILDTGSTDQTVNLFRKAGATVYEHEFSDFDFSAARNMCISLTPRDCDWLFVADLNDHFTPLENLHTLLAHVHADAASVNYLSSETTQYYEPKIRLHRPNTHIWCKAVHEYLVPINHGSECSHIPWDVTKHINRKLDKHTFYVEICEREHARNPQDPHYSWWTLSYYRQTQNWDRLEYFCKHYLDHTPAYQIEFRVYAWIYLSECVQHYNWDKSVDLAVHAFSESLMFKHQVPECTADAAHRLHELGISLIDTRTFI